MTSIIYIRRPKSTNKTHVSYGKCINNSTLEMERGMFLLDKMRNEKALRMESESVENLNDEGKAGWLVRLAATCHTRIA